MVIKINSTASCCAPHSKVLLVLPERQSLNRLPIWNSQNCSVFPLAFAARSLQGHWWGFISRNYVVWPIFFLMNVFIALKGTHLWFLLSDLIAIVGLQHLTLHAVYIFQRFVEKCLETFSVWYYDDTFVNKINLFLLKSIRMSVMRLITIFEFCWNHVYCILLPILKY